MNPMAIDRNCPERMPDLELVFSVLRHELGNSVNSLKLTLEVLFRNFDSFDEDRKLEFLKRSMEQVTRQHRILDGMKAYSKGGQTVSRRKKYANFNLLEHSLGEEQLEKIEILLKEDLIDSGVSCVLLIDMAGNIISRSDNGRCGFDMYTLAALSAANFGAMETMAKLIGENDFSLLFHKGQKESLHFSKVTDELILLAVFGQEMALGILRLKVTETIQKLKRIWEDA